MKKWIALFLFGLTHNFGRILLMSTVFVISAAITALVIRHYDPQAPIGNQVETGAPAGVPPGSRETIAQENWQFDIPGAGWEKSDSTTPGIKIVLKNEQAQKLVLFVKEPTTETYDRYVVGNMRTVSQAGAPILGASNLTMHGEKFAVILAGQGNIWIWVTVKDGFGYVLTCGGAPAVDGGTNDALDNMCVFIAKSLQIK